MHCILAKIFYLKNHLDYLLVNLKDNFGVQTITILVVSQYNLSASSFLVFLQHICVNIGAKSIVKLQT